MRASMGISMAVVLGVVLVGPAARAEERCSALDAKGVGGQVCLVWSAGDGGLALRLEHRPDERAGQRVPPVVLDLGREPALRPDERVLLAFDLVREALVWLPFKATRAADGPGAASPEDECVSRLYRFEAGDRRWESLPVRLVCRRPCSMQFLSYQTRLGPRGPQGTRLFHECTVDGQYLRSTYAWEDGRLTPLEIAEPKARDALARGFAPPPLKPVCQRSAAVRQALERALGQPCEALGPDQLARVTRLDLSGQQVARLAPGDFSGLPELTSLELIDNPLVELSPGTFDGLWKLHSLSFQGCRLRTLPGGLFSQLGSLRDLYLNHNALESLPADAFAGLTSLDFLSLDHNKLTARPEAALAPLPRGCKVYANGNPFAQ
ncbi:MAG TPA: leucine-rich repeat domain-containing protein [Myxococcota bacterium]|nr:leucine-rich repeat domain-containing protein [Myxococcota bacterium]HRY96232.1 leucine-rich repeat domain-containing protein [Myxococcota bacterium]HSA23545.1 leucine-rich repeat domain-containing protein [Myxococcota bacterium]